MMPHEKELCSPGFIQAAEDGKKNLYRIENTSSSVSCSVSDGFSLSKSDSSGNCLWSRSLPEADYYMAVEKSGMIFIAGNYSGKLILPGKTLTSSGRKDFFIMKVTSTGTVSWIKGMGGTGDDRVSDIAVDDNGSVFITGAFMGSISVDGSVFSDTAAVSAFVIKLDVQGGFKWFVKGTGQAEGWKISADHHGNAYFLGGYHEGFSLGNSVQPFEDDPSGMNHLCAKIGPAGSVEWVRPLGGNHYFPHDMLRCDNDGNIFLSRPNRYGPFEIKKLSNGGEILWTRTGGGGIYDHIDQIIPDDSGNVLLSGNFFGEGSFGSIIIPYAEEVESRRFIAKVDRDGNFISAYVISGR